jgi:hypothetical protein
MRQKRKPREFTHLLRCELGLKFPHWFTCSLDLSESYETHIGIGIYIHILHTHTHTHTHVFIYKYVYCVYHRYIDNNMYKPFMYITCFFREHLAVQTRLGHHQAQCVIETLLWQSTWQKQFTGGKIYFGSWLQRFWPMVTWPHCCMSEVRLKVWRVGGDQGRAKLRASCG